MTNLHVFNLVLVFITVKAQALMVLTFVGCLLGSLASFYPADKYGRKMTLVGNTAFFLIGSLFACSGEINTLYMGRFLIGIGCGVLTTIVPIYIYELAPPASRGVFTATHQVSRCLSLFQYDMPQPHICNLLSMHRHMLQLVYFSRVR